MKIVISIILILLSLATYCQKYVDGEILTITNDLIQCKILQHKKQKDKKKDYQQVWIIKDSGDTVMFTSADIIYYIREDEKFVSYNYIKKDGTLVLSFIKLIENGRAIYYERLPIPEDKVFRSYLMKRGEKSLYVFPQIENIVELDENSKRLTCVNVENGYRTFFADYFSDCESVRNQILTGFINVNDIVGMVRSYNKCK